MSDWDHRDAYASEIGHAELGQQAQGGVNRDNNCVPTTWARICQAYRGPLIAPQTITDLTYGTTFHGPEDYGPTLATLRGLWPDCPPTLAESPFDTLGRLDAEGPLRHAIASSFWSDRSGVIQPSPAGVRVLHVSVVVAHVGGQVLVMNSEHEELVVLSDADFRAATAGSAGQMVFFQRALPSGEEDDMGWSLDQKREAILECRAHWEHWPGALADVDFFASQIKDDGGNLLEVRDQLARAFQRDGWVSIYERIGTLEATVAAVAKAVAALTGHDAPSPELQELDAQVGRLDAQIAAIARATTRGGG